MVYVHGYTPNTRQRNACHIRGYIARSRMASSISMCSDTACVLYYPGNSRKTRVNKPTHAKRTNYKCKCSALHEKKTSVRFFSQLFSFLDFEAKKKASLMIQCYVFSCYNKPSEKHRNLVLSSFLSFSATPDSTKNTGSQGRRSREWRFSKKFSLSADN